MTEIQILLDSIQRVEVAVPSAELMILLGLLTVALVFRAVRTGLLIAYLFAFRWGWLFFAESLAQRDVVFMQGYAAFGVLALILGILGMLQSES